MAKKKTDFNGLLKQVTSTNTTVDGQTVSVDDQPGHIGEAWLEATTTASTELLSADEQERLTNCESIIHRNMAAFMEVGTALQEIRRDKLYRANHRTFEAYCEDVFGMKRRSAYLLMADVEIVQQLKLNAEQNPENTPVMPNTASHANALVEVDEAHRQEVWNTVVEQAVTEKRPITAKQIAKTNERLSGRVPKVKPTKKGKATSIISDTTSDDFSDDQLEYTRSALKQPDTIVSVEDQEPGSSDLPAGESAHLKNTLKNALVNCGDGDIKILVNGGFLVRNGLEALWELHRPHSGTVDEDFTDYLSYHEAKDLGIC
ncbi:MAG: hypothetical protein LH609_08995 [Rudanella sp.]|nr:hypothetical protein [Rudanella sp.]